MQDNEDPTYNHILKPGESIFQFGTKAISQMSDEELRAHISSLKELVATESGPFRSPTTARKNRRKYRKVKV